METVYKASPTLRKFHRDPHFVRAIMGPFGSGKSVGMCFEIFRRAVAQTPDMEGKRRSKWVVARNTYRELMDTTIKTWHDWFPQDMGLWKKMDLTHLISIELPDKTTVELEVIFRALDKPDDVKKLLSMEATAGWLNEAREIPKAILDGLQSRVGRFPPPRDFGVEKYTADLYWSGIIMDTNPPDDDHWFYKLFEEDHPEGFVLYKQPSGIAPDAENRDNLHPDYYTRLMSGKQPEWINVYVHGKYGNISDGMPIYPEFNWDTHSVDYFIEPDPNLDLWVGIDFGRTPAAVFAQQGVDTQWKFIDEIITENMGAVAFAEILGNKLRKDFRGYSVHIFGDPAGDERTQVDDRTPFDVLFAAGIDAIPSPSQDPVIRREAVAKQFTRMTYTGKPGVIISPKCKVLRKAWNGNYKYRRMQVAGEERYENKPLKNRFSHPAEAAEYLLVGAGEDKSIVGAQHSNNLDYSKLNRAAG